MRLRVEDVQGRNCLTNFWVSRTGAGAGRAAGCACAPCHSMRPRRMALMVKSWSARYWQPGCPGHSSAISLRADGWRGAAAAAGRRLGWERRAALSEQCVTAISMACPATARGASTRAVLAASSLDGCSGGLDGWMAPRSAGPGWVCGGLAAQYQRPGLVAAAAAMIWSQLPLWQPMSCRKGREGLMAWHGLSAGLNAAGHVGCWTSQQPPACSSSCLGRLWAPRKWSFSHARRQGQLAAIARPCVLRGQRLWRLPPASRAPAVNAVWSSAQWSSEAWRGSRAGCRCAPPEVASWAGLGSGRDAAPAAGRRVRGPTAGPPRRRATWRSHSLSQADAYAAMRTSWMRAHGPLFMRSCCGRRTRHWVHPHANAALMPRLRRCTVREASACAQAPCHPTIRTITTTTTTTMMPWPPPPPPPPGHGLHHGQAAVAGAQVADAD